MNDPHHKVAVRSRFRTWSLFGLLCAGLVGLLLLQLFGPAPPVFVSKQTTFVTTPLAEDGLPNFGLAMYARQRKGVTRENNGARQFWMAMGRNSSYTKVPADEFAALGKELDFEGAIERPLVGVVSPALRDKVAAWLADKQGKSLTVGDKNFDATAASQIPTAAEELLSSLAERPWTAGDAPAAAEWVVENKAALDLLREAAAKPKFYSPSASLLANPNTSLSSITFTVVQLARDATRSLMARAMSRIAAKEYDEAWQDVLACWRLGANIGRGPTLVDNLVGIAIRHVAQRGTLILLDRADASEELLRRIQADLAAQSASFDVATTMDRGERIYFIDGVISMLTRRYGKDDFWEEYIQQVPLGISVDPNIVLEIGNTRYDELVRLARLPIGSARTAALDKFEDDITRWSQESKTKIFLGLLSRTKRSELMADVYAGLFLPAMGAAMTAADRDAGYLELTRIASALALHRLRTGSYPEGLAPLVPAEMSAVPNDPFRMAPLTYERRGEGYLLYSVFANGVDDGGTDASEAIVKGEWDLSPNYQTPPPDETDLVIRLPRLERPAVAPSAEAE